jgi:hypothetical protein
MHEPVTIREAQEQMDAVDGIYDAILLYMELVEAEGLEPGPQLLYMELIWEQRHITAVNELRALKEAQG